jgi:hypothetical protein
MAGRHLYQVGLGGHGGLRVLSAPGAVGAFGTADPIFSAGQQG